MAMAKMRGKAHGDLNYPDLPPIFLPIIDSFNNLDSYSYQEIQSYCKMTGVRLDDFDISLMKDIELVRNLSTNGTNPQKVLEAFNYG